MYLEIINDNIYLKEGMHDFNYIKVINKKNRLPFKKYYVYNNGSILRISNPEETIKILEIVNNPKMEGTKIVVYVDPHERLSFMIAKPHKVLSLENVLEKAESNPPHRIFIISFKKSIYLIGIIRFRYANMREVNLSVGYDKSLNYKFNYLFSKKVRKKFSEFTNKLFLPFHFGFSKIPSYDLLTKYNKTSEINNPLYIKSVTEDSLNYYYQLKQKGFDRYHKKALSL